jgi:hypothetical protein
MSQRLRLIKSSIAMMSRLNHVDYAETRKAEVG